MDNAYWLWTFQGRLLQKNNKDRFCQLLWRPRPPTLLSTEQIKVQFLLYTVCVCCWVCGASDDKHNFSDTSYESCTVAPDSSSNLRLPPTPHYTCVHHVLRWCVCEAICHLTCCHIHSSVLLQMIKKDLKKYSKIFEQKDRLSQSKASKVWPVYIYILTYLWESLLEMLFPIFHVLSPTSSISIG